MKMTPSHSDTSCPDHSVVAPPPGLHKEQHWIILTRSPLSQVLLQVSQLGGLVEDLHLVDESAPAVSILGAPRTSNSLLRPSNKREGGPHSYHAQEVANQVTTPPSEQVGSLKQSKSWRHQKSTLKNPKGTIG
ncbi:hypothetical protein Nepgr_019559 [Nepenthes gracilis]|uniref:Uncharacterized protein n=1 Tax=Nepenthes gracilis TaxID=150966 RepID=A0AAD3STP4_NEPGR|nr:hypothetical protein Nepgr_019559 [Nepenthes gracilis]